MILHGIYENGIIKIIEKNIPKIITEVEIIINNPLSKPIKRIKPKKNSVSSAIIEERYEQ